MIIYVERHMIVIAICEEIFMVRFCRLISNVYSYIVITNINILLLLIKTKTLYILNKIFNKTSNTISW